MDTMTIHARSNVNIGVVSVVSDIMLLYRYGNVVISVSEQNFYCGDGTKQIKTILIIIVLTSYIHDIFFFKYRVHHAFIITSRFTLQ